MVQEEVADELEPSSSFVDPPDCHLVEYTGELVALAVVVVVPVLAVMKKVLAVREELSQLTVGQVHFAKD